MSPYQQGKAAYANKKPSSANPFAQSGSYSNDRQYWFDGWYDAKIGDSLGDVFERHGITWP